MNDNQPIFVKTMLGIVTPVIAFIASNISAIEQWLRVGSLVIGIAVGIASFVAIVRRNGKDKNGPDK